MLTPVGPVGREFRHLGVAFRLTGEGKSIYTLIMAEKDEKWQITLRESSMYRAMHRLRSLP